MPEARFPTTTKVAGMIQAHADLLEQHGITSGIHASRPAAGNVGVYYFSTDAGIWAKDNGSSWDEVNGLSEAYIQGMIDAAIGTHVGNADAHHTAFEQADHDALPNPHHDNSQDHVAPTYDDINEEMVFQVP